MINFKPVILLLLGVICASGQQEKIERTADPSSENPWVYPKTKKSFLLEGGKLLEFTGSTNAIKDSQWRTWSENYFSFDDGDRVEKIALTLGKIEKDAMVFFSNFKNTETLIVGTPLEGVVIAEDCLALVSKLKKIKNLRLSIHGLTDGHLEVLSELPELESVAITFPTDEQIRRLHSHRTPRTVLTDRSLQIFAKISKLQSISVDVLRGDGIEFSFKELNSLKKKKHLKKFDIPMPHDGRPKSR